VVIGSGSAAWIDATIYYRRGMPAPWTAPEGLRVLPDGSWRVGDLPVVHDAGLRELKAHLTFDDDGAFLAAAGRRVRVVVEGPAFQVVSLVLDADRGSARAVLDDGSEEPLRDGSLQMSEETGRFECLVRGGRARATLSRSAHQALLEHAVEDGGSFYLTVGAARLLIRT
jgi:hypothetical protein